MGKQTKRLVKKSNDIPYEMKFTRKEYELIRETASLRPCICDHPFMWDRYPDIPDWRMRAQYYSKRRKNG